MRISSTQIKIDQMKSGHCLLVPPAEDVTAVQDRNNVRLLPDRGGHFERIAGVLAPYAWPF